MKVRKKTIVALALAAGIGAVVVGNASTQVSAQANSDRYESRIARFAQAFGKSENEVKEIFESMREEHHSEREAQRDAKLDQAVAHGDLTQAQRVALEKKLEQIHEEHHNDNDERELYKSLSPEERHERREVKKAEFEAWAEEQGISLEVLESLREGGKHGKGHGDRMMK